MKRYAFEGKLAGMELESFDVIIIGSGIAGLYAALNIDKRLKIALLNKSGMEVSNSYYAQGGIAAVMNKEDSVESHFRDTLEAGAFMCDEAAVRVLVGEGPAQIETLISMGVPFDKESDGSLHTTREGAHSFNRIVHCGGDATGHGVTKKLAELAMAQPNISIKNNICLVDIVIGNGGNACGAVVYENGAQKFYASNNVVICSGGIGRVYRNSTNARSATGDGIAAAHRAGAELKDMEFVQFHPTALIHPDDNGRFFLISEALRGEGAVLRNRRWERFMQGVHPMADLAPRDVVTRAIIDEMMKYDLPHVYLDITARPRSFLSARFPTIYEECMRRGIDIAHDWIPVIPVQHYFMGGIRTDTEARSTVPGLFACGEAACTGVHGANRLASNSLLECLVFSRRCADVINNASIKAVDIPDLDNAVTDGQPCSDLDAIRTEIRGLMTKKGGIIRNKVGMTEALVRVDEVLELLDNSKIAGTKCVETLNIAICAHEVLVAALKRRKSVGAHFRDDEGEE